MTAVSSVTRSTTSAASAASTKLVVGASGAQVKELQQLLKSLGLYAYACDGKFGPKTEAAVKQFQKTHGLTVDGWAGPQTMAKLRAAAAPKPPAPAPTSSGLKLGASGDAVKEVQLRLKALGLYNGAIGGNFGPGTEAAVKAFQKMKGLAQTGVVDQSTLDKLRGGAAPAPAVSIGRGATGNGVKEVQLILTALGFYKSGVDGKFGPVTEGAVKAFQAQQGLPQTGVVDQSTLDKLRAANAARGNSQPTPVTGTLQPGAAVMPPTLPANGTTTPVQPPGLAPVPASASRDQKLQAVLNYGIYFANLEKQNPGTTTYVGGASAYRFGGVGTNGSAQQSGQSRYRSTAGVVGFDCSGLVHTMFAQAGLNVPSNSRDLAKAGQPVSFNDLQPGDILSKAGSHVVVYIGNGQVVEATPFSKVQVGTSNGVPVYEGGGVRISPVSNFTEANGYVARRVL